MEPMETANDVSVIIANYNNARFLEDCLASLFRNPGILEVIVVDDASTDDSVEIASKYPVRLIENAMNFGPVRTKNIGAAEAAGRYILFLDSDTTLDPDYIERTAAFLDERPEAGVVSGRITKPDGERMWHGFGHRFAILRSAGARAFGATYPLWQATAFEQVLRRLSLPFTLNFAEDKVMEVGWVSGMALLTRAGLFRELGGFDEHFWMYHEEPDYCLRARAAGFRTFYTPSTRAYHWNGQSHRHRRAQFMRDSNRYWAYKHGVRWW